tara:strand:+ start:280 stop:711 length:432 start_codon:yes stop_codon:yes gene_type:complete
MSQTNHEIIEMLAEERGLPLERIVSSSRLLHDLGMDGDEAVDFFASLHERYGSDLTSLYANWGDHFGPEGFSCWNGLIIMPAAFASGAIGGWLGLGTTVGFLIGLGILVTGYWAIHKMTPDPSIPITVAEVVSAVEAGAWPER